MTDQELFDKVCKALIEQGGPSVGDGPKGMGCLYRAPNGRKCAAGHLIPDEKYSPAHEAHIVEVLDRDVGEWTIEQLPLVGRLQQAHDDCAWKRDDGATKENSNFVEDFKARARAIAITHRLDPAVLG